MKVLLLSRYGSLGASSRVRFLQYLDYLRSENVEVSVTPLLSNVYLQALYKGGSRWREVIKGYVHRIIALFRVRQFDVVIIEKELFPFFPAVAEWYLRVLGVPYIVDFDDALFHRYDCHPKAVVRWCLGGKIDSVMRNSFAVIAGNSYLAERAQRAGAKKIRVIPTVVDADQYRPKLEEPNNVGRVEVVGWIGSPQTSKYLIPLLPVFKSIQEQTAVRFVAVGARAEDFAESPIEVWPWTEETEVQSIQQFDVGIMPLADSLWERGKCGYKLIQYMACGLPVVASPVGVNCDIVSPGENGFLAETLEDWKRTLLELIHSDVSTRLAMGVAGRALVEKRYSLAAQEPQLLSIIREAGS